MHVQLPHLCYTLWSKVKGCRVTVCSTCYHREFSFIDYIATSTKKLLWIAAYSNLFLDRTSGIIKGIYGWTVLCIYSCLLSMSAIYSNRAVKQCICIHKLSCLSYLISLFLILCCFLFLLTLFFELLQSHFNHLFPDDSSTKFLNL